MIDYRGKERRKYDILVNLASWLHDMYEEKAIKNKWNVNEQCKLKPFIQLPSENQATMLDFAKEILDNEERITKLAKKYKEIE